jgi:hypothetical protein
MVTQKLEKKNLNIILIITDEQGWLEIGFNRTENIITTNLYNIPVIVKYLAS